MIGVACLFSKQIQAIVKWKDLPPLILPKDLRRHCNFLVFYDVQEGVCREACTVEDWRPYYPGSWLCRPLGVELCVIDEIMVPPQLWAYMNQQIMGDPLINAAPHVGHLVHIFEEEVLMGMTTCRIAETQMRLSTEYQMRRMLDEKQMWHDVNLAHKMPEFTVEEERSMRGGGKLITMPNLPKGWAQKKNVIVPVEVAEANKVPVPLGSRMLDDFKVDKDDMDWATE